MSILIFKIHKYSIQQGICIMKMSIQKGEKRNIYHYLYILHTTTHSKNLCIYKYAHTSTRIYPLTSRCCCFTSEFVYSTKREIAIDKEAHLNLIYHT